MLQLWKVMGLFSRRSRSRITMTLSQIMHRSVSLPDRRSCSRRLPPTTPSDAMAPRLAPDELDMITVCAAKKMSAQNICEAISKRRAAEKIAPPEVWAIRRAMAGATHKSGRSETRGWEPQAH